MTAPSRAGRNLPAAIGVGLGLGAIAVALLLFWRPGFVGIIVLAVGLSIIELRGTLKQAREIELAWLPMLVGAAATIILTWPYGTVAQSVGTTLTVLACLVWRLFAGGQEDYLRDVSASAFVTVYIVLFASFATLLVRPEDGAQRVLTFLIAVVAS